MRWLAPILLVTLVLPANAWPGDGVRKMFADVTIDDYGPMPVWGSGVLMVLRVAHGTTAQGALTAVRQWKYKPTGREITAQVEMTFELPADFKEKIRALDAEAHEKIAQ